MERFADGEQEGGRDGRGGGDPDVAEERVGAEREGQHAGDRGRGRDRLRRPVLVPAEGCDDGRICREGETEGDAPARVLAAAQAVGDRAGDAAHEAGEGEGADAGGTAAVIGLAGAPAPLQADQESDAERERDPRKLVEVHDGGGRS